MRAIHFALALLLVSSFMGACDDAPSEDAGPDGAPPDATVDASPGDAAVDGGRDASMDAGPRDAGSDEDGGTADSGAADAGDSGATDAGDSGAADAGDSGAADAGDSGAADGGDAGMADAGSTDVVVLVTVAGVATPGSRVQANAPDGTWIETRLTDSAGEARFEGLLAGSSVTATVAPFTPAFLAGGLVSALGVQPGDRIELGSAGPDFTDLGDFAVDLPDPIAGGTRYTMDTACVGFNADATSGRTFGDSVTPDCYDAVESHVPFAAWTRDATDAQTVFGYVAGAVPLSGSPPSLTGTATPAAWTTTFGTHTATLLNLTDGARVRTSASVLHLGQLIRMSQNFNTDGPAASVAVTLQGFDNVFDAEVILHNVTNAADDNAAVRLAVRSSTVATPSAPRTSTLDVSACPSPPSDVTYVDSPAGAAWTAAVGTCPDNPDGADATFVSLFGDVSGDGRYAWVVMAPPTTVDALTLPTLDPPVRDAGWPATIASPNVVVEVLQDSNETWDSLRNGRNPAAARFSDAPDSDGTRCLLEAFSESL